MLPHTSVAVAESEVKKVSVKQSRGWLITASAERFSEAELLEVLGKYAGGVMQLERGKEVSDKHPEGFLHWQIYVEHSTPIRFSTLRKLLPSAHLEPRRGSKRQAFDYCTKEDTRVSDPVEWGELDLEDRQGQRSDLAVIHEAVLSGASLEEVLTQFPQALRNVNGLRELISLRDRRKFSTVERDVEVYYLSGAAGIGKTSTVLGSYAPDEVYRVTNYKHPFDSYDGQPVLILDEFDGQLDFDFMLNLLDRYPLELPARYRNKWAAFSTVWIISNKRFAQQYSAQRIGEHGKAFARRFTGVLEMKERGRLDVVSSSLPPESLTSVLPPDLFNPFE